MVAVVATVTACAWLVEKPVSAVSRALIPERVREARVDRQQRADLAGQVVSGSMSFEEAGCEYRLGDWDFDTGRCKEFTLPPPRYHDPNAPAPKAHLEGRNPRR
jgi:hypothetical protein